MGQCYIYTCIRCDTDEVFYVGSTIRKGRITQYRRLDQPYFQAVVEEVGKENIRSEIIEVCDEEIRFDREAYWTLYYWERYDLVNRTIADNRYDDKTRQLVFNEEVCAKMSAAWSEERKRQQAERCRARQAGNPAAWTQDLERLEQMKQKVKDWWTPERRAEASESRRGDKHWNYGDGSKQRGELNGMYGVHLTGELNGMYGKHHSDETKEKIIKGNAEWRKNHPEEVKALAHRAALTRRNNAKLPVSEIFLSVQGEGKNVGRPAIFIRLFGCPLSCSYCDSHYATHGSDFKWMTITEIVDHCEYVGQGCKYICLTGGEPLNFHYSHQLVCTLDNLKYDVDIETCGAIDIEPFTKGSSRIRFTVDYKCPSSGMEDKMVPGAFTNLTKKDTLKFVVSSVEDLDKMCEVLDTYHPVCEIFASPVFGKIELSTIVEYILEHRLHNVRVQAQLHKIIWDPNMRGV